jgi:hypothetical protein
VIDTIQRDGGYAIAGVAVGAVAVWLVLRRLEKKL